MTATALQVAEAQRILREFVRDKSYQLTPLGMEAAEFLRIKRKRLSKNSLDAYESTLNALALFFPTSELKDFEPPVGIQRLEDFLDQGWGGKAPASYNRHLSALKGFFAFQVMREKMHGDPTLKIERAKKRQVFRETFSGDQSRLIIAAQESLRDRIALRLLLHYGLRRGSLQAVQFKHFDHVRKRLTIFAKGGTVRELPIPQSAFWHDLERHIMDSGADPSHYLMQARWSNRHGQRSKPDQRMSAHALHKWWYRCLRNAGLVPEGVMKGERMHKARHTAGQNLLDSTGNLKAVQRLLGHASIATTGDVYADWDVDALAQSLAETLEDGE